MIKIIIDNMLYMGIASAVFSLLLLLITFLSRGRLNSKLYLAGWSIALAILLIPAYALFAVTSTDIPSKLTLRNQSIPVASYRDVYTNNMDQSVLYMLGANHPVDPITDTKEDPLTVNHVSADDSASGDEGTPNVAATIKDTAAEADLPAADTSSSDGKAHFVPTLREVLFAVWVLGVVVIGTQKGVVYFRFKREMIRGSRPSERSWDALIPPTIGKNLRVREARIASPIVFGVFRPIIFIPDRQQSEENTRYALMHEGLHILRKDLLLKTIAEIGAVLNFFNPFAWLIRKKVTRYSEVSCDEAVAVLLSEEERKGYALSILDYMENATVPEPKYPGMLMSFSGKPGDVKGRIKHIMEFRKMRRPVVVISAIVILFAMLFGLITACSLAFSDDKKETSDAVKTNESTGDETIPDTTDTTEETADITPAVLELSDFAIAPTYYLASMFSDYGYAIVQDSSHSNQYFFIDESGQQVGDLTFDRYLTSDFRIWKEYGEFGINGYLWIHYNGYWGFVNQDCELVVEPMYQDVMSFGSNGLAGVYVDHKWGFINESGEMVIEPQFDGVGVFADCGLCQIESDSKYGFINASGEVLAEPIYDAVIFDGGFYDWMGPFTDNGEGLVAVCSDNKWGLLRADGEVLCPPIYDSFFYFASHSLAVVYQDGLAGYLNADGEEVIPCEYACAYDFGDNGLAPVMVDGKFGYIDVTGEYVLQPKYDGAGGFAENGLAPVSEDGVWGYINDKGEYILQPEYVSAYDFSDSGYAVVFTDDKCGVIQASGEYVISPTYGNIYEVEGTDSPVFAVMDDNNNWGLMNASEEYILEPNYTYLTFPRPYSDEGPDLINHSTISAALIMIGGNNPDEQYYGIASSDGTILLPPCSEYTVTAIAKNGMVAMEYNGKYGYVQLPGAS